MKCCSRVSVVIPTYNGINLIQPCLNSLREQERKPDEIIVVDDASTDGTSALISASYPDVQLVRRETNSGFATAVNAGITKASGEYIALLNNDTQAHPQWLAELAKVLDEQLSVSFCSSKMLFADRPDIINSIGIGFTRTGIAMDVGIGERDSGKFGSSRPIFGACAGAALYRRRLFDEIGLFDEDLVMWYEDVDLSLRAQLAGHQCLYVPDAIVYHKGGGTVSSNERKHIYYCCRNQVLVLVKNLPRPLLARYMLRLGWVSAKHSAKSLLKGETTPVAGYYGALKSLNQFLKKRRLTVTKSKAYESAFLSMLQLDRNGFSPEDVPPKGLA